jgi:glycosyltransferase involved in cell wall biosynthesis
MLLDAIICTYNRPDYVISLVEQLKKCSPRPTRIIVVDSSNENNIQLENDADISYYKSDRKSQPYQRYLGGEKSNSEVLVFFDDDVKILKFDLFSKIQLGFQNVSTVGVSLGIHYENGIALNQKKKVSEKDSPKTGKISWLGRTSGLPNTDMFVDYFPGPIMAFRKTIVFNLFDEYLFDIFERKIAMGEDKAISMKASKYGYLYYYGSEDYLYHPPIESTYYKNEVDFVAKTTFSRLWLSKIYAEVKGKKPILAYVYFGLYCVKQIPRSILKFNRLKGNLKACGLVFGNSETPRIR